MVRSLIEAQEAERRAIAYDLHDGLTQYVMASHAHFESSREDESNDAGERAEREMDHGLRYLKEAVLESRRLVNGLRALALDDLGLAGALEQLVAEEKDRAEWQEAEFQHNLAGRRFEVALETALYRVAQEALTNARKYAQTSKIKVSLIASPETPPGEVQLVLEVQDWGQGFRWEEKLQEGRIGLHSMRERVHLMGGVFHVQSEPGKGACIRAVVPAQEVSPATLKESHRPPRD
jgi:signal transduction histidine kinase